MNKDNINWLLVKAIAILVSYCIVGYFTPKPYISSVTGMFAIMIGGMMFFRYIETAYEILVKQRRGESGGGHIAILGATAVGFGLVYSGLFRIIWNYFESPLDWAGTSTSTFGLFMIVLGSLLIARAPEAVSGPSKFPTGFWRNTIILMGFIVAFVAGMHFSNFQQ